MNSKLRSYSQRRDIALPCELVWRLLSDTDHLNRVLGLLPVQYQPVETGRFSLRREAQSRLGAALLRWNEYPFQWQRERGYSVRREYFSGPLLWVEGDIELQPSGENTQLRVYADVSPRYGWLTPALNQFMQAQLRKTFSYCETALKSRAVNADYYALRPLVKQRYEINQARLDAALHRLPNQEQIQKLALMLRHHLSTQDDDAILNMRPRVLARLWNADEDAVLRLCLHATRAGILNLTWNVLCPNCRVPKAEYLSLAELQNSLHCDLCGVSYGVSFDRSVELKFSVHPQIRAAQAQIYCIGGPFITPHVWIQRALAHDASTRIEIPPTSEPLRLRVLRANFTVEFSEDGPTRSRVVFSKNGPQFSKVHPDSLLEIENQSGEDFVFVLETTAPDADATTAAEVTAMQEFRDLFSSEVLTPGQQIGVESLSLLFSDLRDSTQLYENVGDAPAYGHVRDHFDFLREHIMANHGGIVKNIGDAIMASFTSPADAVRAALDIQRNVADFNRAHAARTPIVIKLGVHHGPAIAVNANERLDYFGRTVNIAARVQNISNGNDLVLTDDCFTREDVQAALGEYSLETSRFEANLKGIEQVMIVHRITLRSPELSE